MADKPKAKRSGRVPMYDLGRFGSGYADIRREPGLSGSRHVLLGTPFFSVRGIREPARTATEGLVSGVTRSQAIFAEVAKPKTELTLSFSDKKFIKKLKRFAKTKSVLGIAGTIGAMQSGNRTGR